MPLRNPDDLSAQFLTSASSNFFNTSASLNLTNISASFSSGAASFSVAAPQPTASFYENMEGMPNSVGFSLAQSVSAICPFQISAPMSFSFLRVPIAMSGWGSTTLATTDNTTINAGMTSSWIAMVYKLGTGTGSRSLQSVASGVAVFNSSWQVANSTGGKQTAINAMSYPSEGGVANYATTMYSTQTNLIYSSTHLTDFTGTRFLDVPFANSLAVGAYWLGLGWSSSSSTNAAGGGGATNLSLAHSNLFFASQPNLTMKPFGAAGAASYALQPGNGSFTTAGGVISTASLNLSNISSWVTGSQPRLYFMGVRQA